MGACAVVPGRVDSPGEGQRQAGYRIAAGGLAAVWRWLGCEAAHAEPRNLRNGCTCSPTADRACRDRRKKSSRGSDPCGTRAFRALRLSVVTSSVGLMNDDLSDLDAAGLLAAASGAVRARRLAEVRDLEVLAAVGRGPLRRTRPIRGMRLVQLGGEGTPRVQDFCLGEIALARGTGVTATLNATADTLDLDPPAAGDLGGLPGRRGGPLRGSSGREAVPAPAGRPGRAWSTGRWRGSSPASPVAGCSRSRRPRSSRPTPPCTSERVEAERRRRYVSSLAHRRVRAAHRHRPGRSRRRGLGRRDRRRGSPRSSRRATRTPRADELRVHRVRLARPPRRAPDRCCSSTVDPTRGARPSARPSPSDRVPCRPARRPPHRRPDPARTARPSCTCTSTRPPSTAPRGVARVEGLGPVTLTGLHALLARTHLVVKPVIDLSDRVRTTAYEHPESLKERVHLVTGGDYWPYATSTSRNVDYDHPIPFTTHTGPPRPDRHPQLRSTRPATSPLEDPRRLPRQTMRPGPLRLADPARARHARRPPRHPPDQRQARPDDPRRAGRRGHLPCLSKCLGEPGSIGVARQRRDEQDPGLGRSDKARAQQAPPNRSDSDPGEL